MHIPYKSLSSCLVCIERFICYCFLYGRPCCCALFIEIYLVHLLRTRSSGDLVKIGHISSVNGWLKCVVPCLAAGRLPGRRWCRHSFRELGWDGTLKVRLRNACSNLPSHMLSIPSPLPSLSLSLFLSLLVINPLAIRCCAPAGTFTSSRVSVCAAERRVTVPGQPTLWQTVSVTEHTDAFSVFIVLHRIWLYFAQVWLSLRCSLDNQTRLNYS